jgi:hypothetical protein
MMQERALSGDIYAWLKDDNTCRTQEVHDHQELHDASVGSLILRFCSKNMVSVVTATVESV